MKGFKTKFLLPLLGMMVLSAAVVFAAEEKKDSSADTAAVVNGTVITRQEVDNELEQLKSRMSRQGREVTDTEVAAMKNDILDNLIDYQLMYQESMAKGIVVNDEEVTERLSGIKKRFPTEEEFRNELAEMKMSETDIQQKIRQGISIQKFIDAQIVPMIVISDQDAKAFYDANPNFFKQPEQVKASHILVKVDPNATEEQKTAAKKKIEGILEKVQKGDDFSALAKEMSDCPSSANGGDLGYFGRGQMVPEFENTAFSLKPNEVSDITETQFGYHIIKVTDKKTESMIAFNDVKEKISGHLKQQNVQKEVRSYIEKLKERSDIKKFL